MDDVIEKLEKAVDVAWDMYKATGSEYREGFADGMERALLIALRAQQNAIAKEKL